MYNIIFDIDKKEYNNIVITKTIKDIERLDKIDNLLILKNNTIKLNSYEDGFYNFYTLEDTNTPFISFAIKHYQNKRYYKIFYISIDIH